MSRRLWTTAALSGCLLATPAFAADGFSAGIEAGRATVADIGLPLYPGALPQVDKPGDEAGARLGLWGGSFGFRMVVVKLASRDSLDQVAAFYRQALGRYGTVLDCSAGSARRAEAPATDRQALRCDTDDAKAGTGTAGGNQAAQIVFKVGRKSAFRLVALKAVPDGVHFQLLQITAPSE
jgi:hypothetical protein